MLDQPTTIPPRPKIAGKKRYNATGNRWCTRCKEFLPIDRFGKSHVIADGLHIYCRQCHATSVKTHRAIDPEKTRTDHREEAARFYSLNASKMRDNAADRRRRARQEALAAYGGTCTCCGETTFEFLSLDHIDGGGNAHRRDVVKAPGSGIYFWAKRNGYPPILQVLCHNCNMAKAHVGYCPHQGIPDPKPIMNRRPRVHE